MHPTIDEFIQSIILAGKTETARSYRHSLSMFSRYLEDRGIDPLTVTTDHLRDHQRYLAEVYRTANGIGLKVTTQVNRISAIKRYYDWLERRSYTVSDPARKIEFPHVHVGLVKTHHLSMQEATALVQTKAKVAAAYPEGCNKWADEMRSLAVLTTALASGRRLSGLRALKVQHVDFKRGELRAEKEKGKGGGRVLPMAGWAMGVLRIYVNRARPILNWHQDNDWLFVGELTPCIGKNTLGLIVDRAHHETVAANPDLTDLPDKKISAHSLRVTFATLLFKGGANIRTINELMMHEQLGTTSRYTPVPLEDLRRVCLAAHPRA